MSTRITVFACLIAVVFCSCNKGSTPPTHDEILIGEYGSMSGTTAAFGISASNGINMALDEANNAGGVGGKKVKVIVEDDQGKPEEAQTVVTKLINKDRVVAILGEVASSRSLAAAPVCQSAKIPMITPSSTNPKVTAVGDYIFRVCFIDSFQGLVMAKFAANTLKLKNVAILRDVRNEYSVGLSDVFTENFTKLGGTIVANESYSEGDNDFSAQLTSIKSKNPEAVFVPGYYTEVGLIARQSRKLGFTVPLLGADGWDSSRLLEIGGDGLEGSYFANHYSVHDPNPVIQQFVAAYKARYKEVPDTNAVLGYDAARLLIDAFRKANGSDPAAVRNVLASTKDFKGVTGTITMDQNRNPVKPAVVLKIHNGDYVYIETVHP